MDLYPKPSLAISRVQTPNYAPHLYSHHFILKKKRTKAPQGSNKKSKSTTSPNFLDLLQGSALHSLSVCIMSLMECIKRWSKVVEGIKVTMTCMSKFITKRKETIEWDKAILILWGLKYLNYSNSEGIMLFGYQIEKLWGFS